MPTGLQTQGIVSVNWRNQTLPALNTATTIIQTTVSTTYNFNVSLSNIAGSMAIQLTVGGSNSSNTFYAWHPRTPDSFWHQDAFAFDTSAQTVKWLADGTAVVPQTSFNGSGWAANFAQAWGVGAAGASGKNVISAYLGDMADLTLWPAAYVDVTDPAIAPRFFYAAGEVPMRMGATGWRVLQDQGFLSQICLSGPASMFLMNMAAGGFDFAGQSYIDTTPTSMFTLAAGNLVTALSDPWSDPT